MTNILLTGATGFIGSALVNLLNNNYQLHTFSRTSVKKPNWYTCDILNPIQVTELMKTIKPDYLIHLAWYVEHQLFWSSEKNIPYIAATANLYQQFSFHGGKKAIFIGTCAEYESNSASCDENHTPLIPSTLYGLAKKQTFELLSQLQKDNPHYAPFCWLRIFNIFGPRENPNRLIPHIFASYLKGLSPVLNNPLAIRDHLYVENFAEIVNHLLFNHFSGAINVGYGLEMSIAELANIIHSRYFSHLPPPICKKNACENYLVPNLEKLAALKIQLPFNLEQSLDKTFAWFTQSTLPVG